MIKNIKRSFGNVDVNLEVKYTGPEIIRYTIEDNKFHQLPENSLEENFQTLSLPDDFEKMCAIQNNYHIISCTPSTITFDNNKTCNVEVFSLGKTLVCENDLLITKSITFDSPEVVLQQIEIYKTQVSEKIENESDVNRKEKLQTLCEEIDFVIASLEADEQFPYMLYKFDTV
jgi:hypothetical protein